MGRSFLQPGRIIKVCPTCSASLRPGVDCNTIVATTGLSIATLDSFNDGFASACAIDPSAVAAQFPTLITCPSTYASRLFPYTLGLDSVTGGGSAFNQART